MLIIYLISELCEEWALAHEGSGVSGTGHDESDDVSEARFTLKYLGSTLVETPSSEEATAEAIKTVITMVSTYHDNSIEISFVSL